MGKHGYSWHIEHIHGKKDNINKTFSLENLTLACIDCNYSKNQNLDNKKIPYDIIDPNSKNFLYRDHLMYLQVSTDRIHILKYKHISEPGKKTYERLNFINLEYEEILKSINRDTLKLMEDINGTIYKLAEDNSNIEISEFLLSLKQKLTSC